MPKKGNNSLKQKARRLARCENIPYSKALARLTMPATVDQSPNHAPTSHQQLMTDLVTPKVKMDRLLADLVTPKVKMDRLLADLV
ncbi:hypothetical protein ACH433_02675, partial [Streptomyces olivaceoviridis]